MTAEIAAYEGPGLPALSVDQVKTRVGLIQQVMKSVMKEGTHYGKIPGVSKPSLWKPGAETLAMTFQIAVEPIVEDLSTGDEARYRVTCRATSQVNGSFLGSGIGEASSSEEKYCWRAAVCPEEFAATPEDRRRTHWGKAKGNVYKVNQVRTHPADLANTVLKMAKKRAQIDMTLTVTGASDMFTQDPEDFGAASGDETTRGAEAIPAVGPAEMDRLSAEMVRTAMTPQRVARNLATQAHYDGALNAMPMPIFEWLMRGLAKMKTKTAPVVGPDAADGAAIDSATSAIDADEAEFKELGVGADDLNNEVF